MTRSWWQTLFHAGTAKRCKPLLPRRRPRGFSPRLESLEDRIALNGAFDATFDTDGKVTTDILGPVDNPANAVVIQPADQKILIVGGAGSNIGMARYNPNGTLDTTFGTNGIVDADLGGVDVAFAAALQTDGKIVVAGSSSTQSFASQFTVARFLANGSLDTTFGTGGRVTTSFGGASATARGVAIQTDGKIVAVGETSTSSGVGGGETDFAVARFTSSGALDTTFDGDGKLTTNFVAGSGDRANAVVLQTDGKIVVVGTAGANTFFNTDFALARYTTTGALDTTFDTDGKVQTNLTAGFDSTESAFGVALQTDGKLVVVGESFSGSIPVARYNTNGGLDTTFDTDGIASATVSATGVGSGRSVFVLGDGKILVSGFVSVETSLGSSTFIRDFAAARLNADGTQDATYGTAGATTTRINGVNFNDAAGGAIQADGKLVVVRAVGEQSSTDFGAVRFTTGGALDTTFDGDGKLTTSIIGSLDNEADDIAIQTDGKIVAAGFAAGDFALFRYNSNGSLDTTFDGDGRVTTDFSGGSDFASGVAILPDGKILVAGSTFNFSVNPFVQDIALARYNADGSLDATFGTGGRVTTDFSSSSENVSDLLLLPDGKFLVSGSTFSTGPNPTGDAFVVRYNANGTLDTTFGTGGRALIDFLGGFDASTALALQADGKILVGGNASPAAGSSDIALARLLTTGALDTTFDGDGKVTLDFASGASDTIHGIAVQTDQRIVVAGNSGVFNSTAGTFTSSFVLARFTTAGALDTTFDTDGKLTVDLGSTGASVSDSAEAVVIQADGKIVAVGFAGGTEATGSEFAVVRLNTNGGLDTTFDGDGKKVFGVGTGARSDRAVAVALQADGRIVLAGETESSSRDFALARLTTSSAGRIIVAPDQGGPPRVKIFNTDGQLVGEFDAYGPTFMGGVRVAAADITGDGIPEIFTAPGPTGAPFVNIFDGVTFSFRQQFQVYGDTFTLGVNLAVGNVVGDGRPEIVVAPDQGGQPFINVLDSQSGQLVQQFLAYGQAFTGGVRIALANTDATNGSLLEVLTAPQAGGAPFVNQFNAAATGSAFIRQHQVYGAGFTGGLYLAGGNVNNTGLDDFIVGPGSGGDPYVNGFDGTTGDFVKQVQAYGLAFKAGVRVALVDANGDGTTDIVSGPGRGGEPYVQIVNGLTQAQLRSFLAFPTTMTAGLFVVTFG